MSRSSQMADSLKHIKFLFSGVFWRQGDTGTLLGQRKCR